MIILNNNNNNENNNNNNRNPAPRNHLFGVDSQTIRPRALLYIQAYIGIIIIISISISLLAVSIITFVFVLPCHFLLLLIPSRQQSTTKSAQPSQTAL